MSSGADLPVFSLFFCGGFGRGGRGGGHSVLPVADVSGPMVGGMGGCPGSAVSLLWALFGGWVDGRSLGALVSAAGDRSGLLEAYCGFGAGRPGRCEVASRA